MPDFTRDTILAMEAGPELDALVDKRLMADSWDFQCPECGSHHFGTNASDDSGSCHDEFGRGCRWCGPREACKRIESYSTDIAAAWEVVEKLVKPGHYNELSYHHDGENLDEPNLLAFMSMSLRDSYCVCATAPTAPLAICRAALLTTLEAKDVTDAQLPVGTT